jgi:hypothetical protein
MARLGRRVRLAAASACVSWILFSPTAAARADAETYLGEACWTVTVNERLPGPVAPEEFLLRTAFIYVGGAHFRMQGTFPEGGGTAVVSGPGEVVGTNLVFTLTFSRDKRPGLSLVDSGTMELRMSPQTWIGTFWAINTNFNTTSRTFLQDFAAGTVVLTACPAPSASGN